ncbi:MAG: hypothetical protein K5799_14945 [Erythrobacter sp.]|nr:hypothetical protein [Erythrobacter sp.]
MSAIDYLSEHGSGKYKRWHVPDLVTRHRTVELVFVFESPHVDELSAGLPVVGPAGKSAMRYLAPGQSADMSLGRFVQERHAAGDGRIAILNVSNVPMQAAAFVGTEAPELEDGEWAMIERARRSKARSMCAMRDPAARVIAEVLVNGLRQRLSAVDRGVDGRVVAAGTFAQRVVAAALPDLSPEPLCVPHPSFNQWNRVANHNLPALIDLKHRFEDQTSRA